MEMTGFNNEAEWIYIKFILSSNNIMLMQLTGFFNLTFVHCKQTATLWKGRARESQMWTINKRGVRVWLRARKLARGRVWCNTRYKLGRLPESSFHMRRFPSCSRTRRAQRVGVICVTYRPAGTGWKRALPLSRFSPSKSSPRYPLIRRPGRSFTPFLGSLLLRTLSSCSMD